MAVQVLADEATITSCHVRNRCIQLHWNVNDFCHVHIFSNLHSSELIFSWPDLTDDQTFIAIYGCYSLKSRGHHDLHALLWLVLWDFGFTIQ